MSTSSGPVIIEIFFKVINSSSYLQLFHYLFVSTHACNVRVACPGKRIRIGCVDFSGALSTVLCGVFDGGSSFLVGWPTVGLGSVSDFRGLFAGAGGIFILGWSAGRWAIVLWCFEIFLIFSNFLMLRPSVTHEATRI